MSTLEDRIPLEQFGTSISELHSSLPTGFRLNLKALSRLLASRHPEYKATTIESWVLDDQDVVTVPSDIDKTVRKMGKDQILEVSRPVLGPAKEFQESVEAYLDFLKGNGLILDKKYRLCNHIQEEMKTKYKADYNLHSINVWFRASFSGRVPLIATQIMNRLTEGHDSSFGTKPRIKKGQQVVNKARKEGGFQSANDLAREIAKLKNIPYTTVRNQIHGPSTLQPEVHDGLIEIIEYGLNTGEGRVAIDQTRKVLEDIKATIKTDKDYIAYAYIGQKLKISPSTVRSRFRFQTASSAFHNNLLAMAETMAKAQTDEFDGVLQQYMRLRSEGRKIDLYMVREELEHRANAHVDQDGVDCLLLSELRLTNQTKHWKEFARHFSTVLGWLHTTSYDGYNPTVAVYAMLEVLARKKGLSSHVLKDVGEYMLSTSKVAPILVDRFKELAGDEVFTELAVKAAPKNEVKTSLEAIVSQQPNSRLNESALVDAFIAANSEYAEATVYGWLAPNSRKAAPPAFLDFMKKSIHDTKLIEVPASILQKHRATYEARLNTVGLSVDIPKLAMYLKEGQDARGLKTSAATVESWFLPSKSDSYVSFSMVEDLEELIEMNSFDFSKPHQVKEPFKKDLINAAISRRHLLGKGALVSALSEATHIPPTKIRPQIYLAERALDSTVKQLLGTYATAGDSTDCGISTEHIFVGKEEYRPVIQQIMSAQGFTSLNQAYDFIGGLIDKSQRNTKDLYSKDRISKADYEKLLPLKAKSSAAIAERAPQPASVDNPPKTNLFQIRQNMLQEKPVDQVNADMFFLTKLQHTAEGSSGDVNSGLSEAMMLLTRYSSYTPGYNSNLVLHRTIDAIEMRSRDFNSSQVWGLVDNYISRYPKIISLAVKYRCTNRVIYQR
jgi:hypothetical protein